MKYENAGNILPPELLAELQRYAAGKLIYVPDTASRRAWGELSGTRRTITERNNAIRRSFAKGASVDKLAEEYFLAPETVRNIVYNRKERDKMEFKEVFALYSDTPPTSYEVVFSIDESDEHPACQYCREINVVFPDRELTLEINCNYLFATPSRIGMYDRLGAAYESLGYECMRIVPTRDGELYAFVNVEGHDCIVYAEEYDSAKTALGKRDDDKPFVGADGGYVCHDDVLISLARVAALRLEESESDYAQLFEPFTAGNSGYEDFVDEYVRGDLKDRIYGKFPGLTERYDRLIAKHEELRAKLRPLACALPRSAFHPVEGWLRRQLLLDENGALRGFRSFMDGGADVNVGFLIYQILYRLSTEYKDTGAEAFAVNPKSFGDFGRDLRLIADHYTFTQEKIAAAPIYYKLLQFAAVYYYDTELWNSEDEAEVAAALDFALARMDADEIDFGSVMR